jgi:hypothetical protein
MHHELRGPLWLLLFLCVEKAELHANDGQPSWAPLQIIHFVLPEARIADPERHAAKASFYHRGRTRATEGTEFVVQATAAAQTRDSINVTRV